MTSLVPSSPRGLEAAREVPPEGLCLGWPKPEADDLSLPVSLGCDSEYLGTRDDPASLAGFGVCGVQPDVGSVAGERAVEECAPPFVDIPAQFGYRALGHVVDAQRRSSRLARWLQPSYTGFETQSVLTLASCTVADDIGK